jgi:hypothetical protein
VYIWSPTNQLPTLADPSSFTSLSTGLTPVPVTSYGNNGSVNQYVMGLRIDLGGTGAATLGATWLISGGSATITIHFAATPTVSSITLAAPATNADVQAAINHVIPSYNLIILPPGDTEITNLLTFPAGTPPADPIVIDGKGWAS